MRICPVGNHTLKQQSNQMFWSSKEISYGIADVPFDDVLNEMIESTPPVTPVEPLTISTPDSECCFLL